MLRCLRSTIVLIALFTYSCIKPTNTTQNSGSGLASITIAKLPPDVDMDKSELTIGSAGVPTQTVALSKVAPLSLKAETVYKFSVVLKNAAGAVLATTSEKDPACPAIEVKLNAGSNTIKLAACKSDGQGVIQSDASAELDVSIVDPSGKQVDLNKVWLLKDLSEAFWKQSQDGKSAEASSALKQNVTYKVLQGTVTISSRDWVAIADGAQQMTVVTCFFAKSLSESVFNKLNSGSVIQILGKRLDSLDFGRTQQGVDRMDIHLGECTFVKFL